MAKPESEPETEFGKRLRLLRKTVGTDDQKRFAQTLGLSQSALSSYERGHREPTSAALAAYSRTTGVSLNWLITGEGEMFADPSKRPAAAPVPAIDADLFRAVGRLILKVYKDEGVKLPPEALLDEQSGAYNALIARAEDPRDITELTALLPWLEARLRKSLAAAAAEPGSGKHAG